mgnify:CR=1 FL=1
MFLYYFSDVEEHNGDLDYEESRAEMLKKDQPNK